MMFRTSALALTACFLISGCDSLGINTPPVLGGDANEPRREGISINRILSGELGGDGPGVNVNENLWRAALETVDFLPLLSADPFSGVLVTDWGSVGAATDERFKIVVYITSDELTVSALNVAVFRQIQSRGQWVDAAVNETVPAQIEDAIVLRARQLRIAEVAG